MRNPKGQIVKYVRPTTSTFCYEESAKGDRLRYARITGASKISLPFPVTIDGWIAYDGTGPIGLNPKSWYCAFPGLPPTFPVKITQLPDGSWIKGTRQNNTYVLVEVDGPKGGNIAWQVNQGKFNLSGPASAKRDSDHGKYDDLPVSLLFTSATPPAVQVSEPLFLEKWQANIVANGQIIRQGKILRQGQFRKGDAQIHGYMVSPPLGGKGSEI